MSGRRTRRRLGSATDFYDPYGGRAMKVRMTGSATVYVWCFRCIAFETRTTRWYCLMAFADVGGVYYLGSGARVLVRAVQV